MSGEKLVAHTGCGVWCSLAFTGVRSVLIFRIMCSSVPYFSLLFVGVATWVATDRLKEFTFHASHIRHVSKAVSASFSQCSLVRFAYERSLEIVYHGRCCLSVRRIGKQKNTLVPLLGTRVFAVTALYNSLILRYILLSQERRHLHQHLSTRL